MVQYIPPPDPQALLPPILACIPTAFVSPRPPPALLPLLSPILRQRLQYTGSSSSSPSDSWLPYLCWDAELAKKLVDTVSDSDAFEPHPTSGQIEMGDIERIKYRRLDEETLHARVALPDTRLEFIFLWRAGEEGEEESNVWLVAEVKPYRHSNGQEWFVSITEAVEVAHGEAFRNAIGESNGATAEGRRDNAIRDDVNDEDDYWAQYDKTPARTPGHDRTPTTTEQGRRGRTTSEAEYFERYAEVQPEMDNDDPSHDPEETGRSTLNGNELRSVGQRSPGSLQTTSQPARTVQAGDSDIHPHISRTPDAIISSASPAIEGEGSLAVAATRQHVSSNLKSLLKLCRGVGIERSEFEELVTTELQALSMLDDA